MKKVYLNPKKKLKFSCLVALLHQIAPNDYLISKYTSFSAAIFRILSKA